MAHHTSRASYQKLSNRLNLSPQGAPPSELLYHILDLLFSTEEAELVAALPLKPFTASQAAKNWKVTEAAAEKTLQRLAGRALLVDFELNSKTEYILPPPMAGFFEFALMRTRDDIDQKILSELYEQYISVEDDFIRELFLTGNTQLGRVFVQEEILSDESALHVLDYERATEVIETATDIGIGLCYCRHKRQHQNRACDAEMDICMTFNTVASSLIRSDYARRVEPSECKELLHKACEQNLVQFGENVQNRVSFICNCCSCCCEALLAAQRFGYEHPLHTSNFIARVEDNCSGCGRCLSSCPVKVISLQAEQTDGSGCKRAVIDEALCLGCGVCVRNCRLSALTMVSRASRVITPVNSTHKSVLMAIERGKLQNLIFDNQVLWSHRALAALLGVILKLPPIKRALACEQIGSRYLGTLCERYDARQTP
ncbi:MAG: 4Fe-4S dicluster domain-containing protein [Deltaproteobacteria bacterium]|nr:MAG: 4Fe-4S dicluster domain-containing protein [Deltaproteobacteria bacterium]